MRIKMDFLFAPLPETNFQMTNEQLRLWQRNAVFECECDNFINRRIETSRLQHLPNLLRRPLLEDTAINAAIQHYGLRMLGERNYIGSSDNNSNIVRNGQIDMNANLPPLRQRPRLNALSTEPERDRMFDRIYQEAVIMAFRTRGIGVLQNP